MIGMPVNLKEFNKKKKISTFIISEYTYKLKHKFQNLIIQHNIRHTITDRQSD